jgi:hypothetical protein
MPVAGDLIVTIDAQDVCRDKIDRLSRALKLSECPAEMTCKSKIHSTLGDGSTTIDRPTVPGVKRFAATVRIA